MCTKNLNPDLVVMKSYPYSKLRKPTKSWSFSSIQIFE
jgi:hypothetical protein